ncbi:MAG: hypothetical protein H6739_20370 [Alphaproteobacteria bacterium]|nr:hypothetical protein [Alphaproteobacteria bacterium]
MIPLSAWVALCPAAVAGLEDVVLELRVTEPLGTPLIDQQVELPFRGEYEQTLGQDTFTVVVEAAMDDATAIADAEVEVIVTVYRLDGPQRVPVRVAGPKVVLSKDARMKARSVVEASEPVIAPDGTDLTSLTWELEAAWSERRAPDWLSEVRAQSVAPPKDRESYVVAWADAGLYSAPHPDAWVGRMEPPAASRSLSVGGVMTWEVISDRGQFIEVRNLQPRKSRKHCIPASSAFNEMDVKLFLRREDLLVVSKTSAVMDYSDGTGSSVASGVPLVPLPGTTLYGYPAFEGLAHGLTFVIPLPPKPLALSYEPLVGGSLNRPQSLILTPDERHQLGRTGAGPVTVVSGTKELYVSPYTDPMGGTQGVVAGGPCAEHRLQAPTKRLTEPPEDMGQDLVLGGGGGFVGGIPPTPSLELPFGVPLYWPDGTEAGIVTRPRSILVEPQAKGELLCVDLAAEAARQRGRWAPEGATLPVCVKAADVGR